MGNTLAEHQWAPTGAFFSWRGWVRPPAGIAPDGAPSVLTCDHCLRAKGSTSDECEGSPKPLSEGDTQYWSKDWEPSEADQSGTSCSFLTDFLIMAGGLVAGIRITLEADNGSKMALKLSMKDAEALLEFLQVELPRMKARMDGIE